MKTLAEQMREAIDDFGSGDDNQEVYVDGFGTWDVGGLKGKIKRDLQEFAALAERDDFEGIHTKLRTGVLGATVKALVETIADEDSIYHGKR